jgi:hypothetical protein
MLIVDRLAFNTLSRKIEIVMNSANLRARLVLYSAKHSATYKGFSTVEVLVGILLTLIFLGVAMQAMVMATAIKIKAQQDSEATNWIQKDVEYIRGVSDDLHKSSGTDAETGAARYETEVEKCEASTAEAGYARDLETTITTEKPGPIAYTSSIGSRPYRLARSTSISNSAPHVLKITYKVYAGTETTGTPVATFYTESIPSAAFSCRQEPVVESE